MSEPIKDGGPAFPAPDSSYDAGFTRIDIPASQGMSLRDWFAGMALQGLLSADLDEGVALWAIDAEPDAYAKRSFQYADAMIAAREK